MDDEQRGAGDSPLISPARADMLELLLHLLANTTRPLVLLGPAGIGKTRLLAEARERKKHTWHCLPIQVGGQVCAQGVLEALAQAATGNAQAKTIALIDDAGLLAAGAIDRILAQARAMPSCRLVLALTPDQLFIKTRTDPAIDDCHFLELPPLARDQCGDFMRMLTQRLKLPITMVDDPLIDRVYLSSHGVPAAVIRAMSELAAPRRRDPALALLLAAVALLVTVALVVQWLTAGGRF